MLVAVLVVVMAMANSGVTVAYDSIKGHRPPLLDCTPAPAPPTGNHSAFRANVATALAALPSAVAAAPMGSFAATRSGRAGRGRAFARGFCFGDGCLACISAAAKDVARGCGGAGGNSRRAGVWRAGCFVAYADTDAPSAGEDAFRDWFYADGVPDDTSDGTVVGECAGDGTAAHCDRCVEESARAAAALGWLPRIGGEKVVVVGYGCIVRVQISSLPWGASSAIVGLAFCLIIYTLLAIIATSVSIDGEFLGAASADIDAIPHDFGLARRHRNLFSVT
ncbi:hypothetical protein ACP4OV_010995 [Aristida adscensionis]